MYHKGYKIPSDLVLILKVFHLVYYYRQAVRRRSLPDLIAGIRQKGSSRPMQALAAHDHEKLEKAARAADFLLSRIIRTKKPCLPRSLALLDWCSQNGIQARIAIGVKKSQQLLEGHSWILIKDQPYRENLNHLAEYTIMLEEDNQCNC